MDIFLLLNLQISVNTDQLHFHAWQLVNVDNSDCNVIISKGSLKLQGRGVNEE